MYIVATPIGHLADISARALQVLAGVDLVAAEDTRHSSRLLRHYAIGTPCLSVHGHNERAQVSRVLQRLQAGDSVALITDAGTPLISDPGFHLVRAAQDAGLRVVPVPGPSAPIAALSVSGQSAERFAFEGFLPARGAARARRLEGLRAEPRTLIFFEAPHRVVATLEAMCEALGSERGASYVREISKIHETVRRTTLGALAEWVRNDPEQRMGEIVIIVQGAEPEASDEAGARRTLEVLLEELPLKRAAVVAARLTGASRNELYQWGVDIKGGEGKEEREKGKGKRGKRKEERGK